ncbi:MAG: 4-hydroxybenzoate octaprenyltransferase [Zoogloeaceae bacterium]|jgi:4-hydroxybenzoate polyprenyltransferase|nr:4-hydroxybenzoate octaprenyltransferase [Zoogloeaceae bacterium]
MVWKAFLKPKLFAYARLLRFNMMGGMLLLWPSMWALWLASRGHPDYVWVLIFAVGAILMHSAGCILNDYADRHFDARVARTKARPLVVGSVGAAEAFCLLAMLCLICFLMVLPRLTALFSACMALAVAVAASYPFAKRFFPLPQAWLGLAFGLSAPMAYAAETSAAPLEAWVLVCANIFWAMAYDTEYAMADRADDIKIGIRSSAITLGRYDVLAVMCCYGAAFLLTGWVGLGAGLGGVFLAFLALAFLFAARHYRLIQDREGESCLRAFTENNQVGMVIFLGIALDYLWRDWPLV